MCCGQKITLWMQERIRTFQRFHISLVKLSSAAFALMVAKLVPEILGLAWYWYLVIAVVLAIPVMAAMFGVCPMQVTSGKSKVASKK